jgi:hypothetical protein
MITRYFEEGLSRCLIGTRGLLGEGWDAKRVNVLIDLTAAGTTTAVHQMRGRSLRLDPALPRKVADNWDVVCVQPSFQKGTADYGRFIRKHQRYFAPTTTGEIESGVSHVHSALSPYGPPSLSEFGTINRSLLERAQNRDVMYGLWQIGTAYENARVPTIRIRYQRSIGLPQRRLSRHGSKAINAGQAWRRAAGTVAVAGAGLLGAVEYGLTLGVEGAVVAAVAGGYWTLHSTLKSAGLLAPSDTLEDIAFAVADGLRSTGGIRPELDPGRVRCVVQTDGYYRVYLDGCNPDEGRLFVQSLDEVLAPLDAPRYIIPRYVSDLRPNGLGAPLFLLQRVAGRFGSRVVYHAVPGYLAVNKERVDAFRRAWNRHVSPGRPLFMRDPRAQAIVEVQRGANPFSVTSQMRTLWH